MTLEELLPFLSTQKAGFLEAFILTELILGSFLA
jgi:hypothetical protein